MFNLKKFLQDSANYLFGSPKPTTPQPATTDTRPYPMRVPSTPNQSQEIKKIYQTKLPSAIQRESQRTDLISKLFTDQNWKQRAENLARTQAINEYQNKYGYNNQPEVKNELAKIKTSNDILSNQSRKNIEDSNKFQQGMVKVAQAGQYVPGFGSAFNVGLAGAEKLFGNNSQYGKDISNLRTQVDTGMTTDQFNTLPEEQRNKINIMRNIGLAATPLDFLGGAGVATSALLNTGKKAAIEGITKGIISASTKEALKQAAKAEGKKLAIGAGVGTGISSAGQLYMNGQIDPLEAVKNGLIVAGVSGLMPNSTKDVIATQRSKILPKTNLLEPKKYNVSQATPHDIQILTDYSNYKNRNVPYLKDTTNPSTIKDINYLSSEVRKSADKLGIDVLNGINPEITNRIDNLLTQHNEYQLNPPQTNVRQLAPEQVKAQLKREREGGFVQLPGGDKTKTLNYRSSHQIDTNTSRNLGDISNIDDIVGQVKSKYGLTNYDQKDITNLKKIVGNPDADVKIYRASPLNEINDGDWVTTSKTYANDIKAQNGGKVYEYTVKAKDLNLPQNIEDNPSLARFSAFQYNKSSVTPQAPKATAALKQEAIPKYMQDKVTPEGYFTEGRYKDSAYPKNFVAKADIPHTNIKAGDRVALIKGRDGRFDAILSKKYKEKSTGYTISRESYVDPESFTQSQPPTPQVTKIPEIATSTPQSRNTNATEQFTIKNSGMDVYGHFYKNEPPSLDTFYFKKDVQGGQGIATTNLNKVLDSFSEKGNKTFTVTDASPEMIDFLKRKEQQGLIKDIGTYYYEGVKNPTPQLYYEIIKPTTVKQVTKTSDIPSYIPKDRVDEYLKSSDYIKDQEFKRMADETKSGDPFDHPDMYENPTPEMKKNLKTPKSTSQVTKTPKEVPAITPEVKSIELPIVGKPLQSDIQNKVTNAERGFIQSAKNSKNVSKAAKAKLDELDKMYEVRNNKELNDTVAKKLSSDPARAHEFAVSNNSDEGTVAAIQLAQSYRKAGSYDLEASLITEKAKRLTEAGREIQAARMMDEMSPEATVLSAAQTINRYNEEAALKNKKLLPELTGKKAKQFSDTADQISKMPEGREKNIALYQLKNDLADLIPSTNTSKLVTIWKAGLLTSPRTTLRNIVGNTIHGVAEIAKDPFAAINDTLLSQKTGNRELTFTTKGTLSGGRKGLSSAKDQLKYGFDPEKTIEKFGVRHITWDNTPVQQAMKKYTDTVFNWLGAQDKLFYKAAESRSLYDQAKAEAINAGRKGDKTFIDNLVQNPTERMKINSTKDAQTAVFQNSNIGSQFASRAKALLRDKNAGLGAIGDIVMPFTGVPSSIAGQMIAYSPIGLVKGIAKDYKVLSSKVNSKNLPDFQRQASQEIGRGVIGTGLLGLGAYLTSQGIMTGQPKDANEAKQWELEGKQANSVMIGGKWRSINSVGPETLVLLAGGKLGEGNDLGTAAANIGKDFLGQTFLSGVQQPLNAISDPVRYGGTYVSGQIPSLIPNIVKDTAKVFDPIKRETKVTGDIVGSTINATKAGLPGLRNTLLPKRDALGNPLPQEPTGLNAYVDLFNSKTPTKSIVVDELSRLYKAGQSATPSKLQAGQTILGQKVTLTPEQLDKLEQTTGQPITKQFEDVMKTTEYQNASDEMKKKVLDNITSNAKNSAKMDLVTGTQSDISQTGIIDTSKLTNQNKITLNKDTFDKSGKNFEEKDGYVYRRNSEGNVTVVPKISFEHDLNTANLTSLKADDNLDGWMTVAQEQAKNIQTQLNDPSIDPLEKVQLTNELNSLMRNAEKYAGYGGFTKPKSGTKVNYADLFTNAYKAASSNQDALRKLLSEISIKRRKI